MFINCISHTKSVSDLFSDQKSLRVAFNTRFEYKKPFEIKCACCGIHRGYLVVKKRNLMLILKLSDTLSLDLS